MTGRPAKIAEPETGHRYRSKKTGQPFDQSFADDDFIDDLSRVVDQFLGNTGLVCHFRRLIQKANFHEVTLEFLLGEFLSGPERVAALF